MSASGKTPSTTGKQMYSMVKLAHTVDLFIEALLTEHVVKLATGKIYMLHAVTA
jgi:hypothetical protein